ncbi:MAG: hypothetical protein EXX96DRAFT_531215 [Benjaminiella poitrasii]|nr:MAG: hypothetical protein EXX96DRAFT_531215 [Benjaminiella poitrasii]
MSTTKAIFTPIKVGTNQLKHRVVLSPLTRFRASPEAVPTDLQAEYYKQRASDSGLLITEATFISRLAGGYPQAPGIYNEEQIKAWKKVTDAVHEKNGVIFSQLWHVGRAGSKFLNPNQEQIVSASDIAINGKNMNGGDFEVPRPLEIKEIKEIIQQYRQAALNAIEAGFDGVEIHSANGYLPDQFINSNSNRRTDIYGGSIENRARFALEIVDSVSEAIGEERTAIRFSPGNPFYDMLDETPVETWGYLVKELQKNHPRLAYLHFMKFVFDKNIKPEDSFSAFRQHWKGPFINSGYSDSPNFAIDLSEKTGDLIAFGRAFISNPDLPERLRNGWELSPCKRETFYTHDEDGYTNYPTYQAKN